MMLRRAVAMSKELKLANRTADFKGNIEAFERLSFPWLFHIYHCKNCSLKFATEQEYEDQSNIDCPNCKTDEYMVDYGSGEMVRSVNYES